jgi:hypothetical protein
LSWSDGLAQVTRLNFEMVEYTTLLNSLFTVPNVRLARDATIADLLTTLAHPEDYVRGVLENLYACRS